MSRYVVWYKQMDEISRSVRGLNFRLGVYAGYLLPVTYHDYCNMGYLRKFDILTEDQYNEFMDHIKLVCIHEIQRNMGFLNEYLPRIYTTIQESGEMEFDNFFDLIDPQ